MFDSVALAAVAAELNAKILHGRVQEIVQLDALTFGFEIFAAHERHYLYVTARPDDARVHLVAQKLRGTGDPSTSLRMLLRKHAENALIDSITQLPHERVLKIQLDHSVEGVGTLVIETIGKYANIILLDADGVVIDAVKRITPAMNRLRTTLPRHKYVPPPAQNKIDPATLTPEKLARALEKNSGASLWQTLVTSIAGVSPLLAREIEYRVLSGAPAQSKDSTRIVAVLDQLMHSPWHPSVAFEDNEPSAFAPYWLSHFADVRPFDSISPAIEAFYGETESYAAVKESLRAPLADARDKSLRKRDALAQEQARAGDIERLRVSGEMILASAHTIAREQDKLSVETEIGRLEIVLDARLSPVANAQKYFKEYHRAKDAAERTPALLARAQADVDYAEQMLNDLEIAENRAEIDAVIIAAREAGLLTEAKQKTKAQPSAPREFTSRDGFTILIGKNARQNEEITFRRSRADDLWLHARNVAGAHVVIVRAGRDIPESTIEEAAELAAQYSQARGDSAVDVIVTERRNVHRVRGGRTGMVTVQSSQVIRVG